MARNRPSITAARIAKWIKEGRGQGRGFDYKSWLTTHDVPSKGQRNRIQGWRHGREHHLLSKLETMYFYLLEWALIVLEIREQFPLLPLEETETIAAECGFEHPTDPKSREHIVMTTDFLVTISRDGKDVELARSIKYVSELGSARVLEKLEIERLYWLRRGVDWGVVTEREIPAILVDNATWVHPKYRLSELAPLREEDIQQIGSALTAALVDTSMTLSRLARHTDKELGLAPGTSMTVIRHLIANRYWDLDLSVARLPGSRPVFLTPPPSAASLLARRFGT